ncbi:hypothetical protein GCM10027280_42170 [Micromonospora polyrhachis]|uniref:Uncharacterized protein n=1 Tax=Micromonospora polyrhachis TaxID=1282883 RepID=A0A7W7SLP1_9ACTN|nr:hypothetical protein [Micromonospora polyrhachis]MBB4957089.1 hypothetical protein [Micromonospora polyrhachis]
MRTRSLLMRTRIAAGLALAAEFGHLAAAWTEAVAWPLLSGCHIVVAVGFGLVFAGLWKPSPRRRWLHTARVLALMLPAMWLFTRTIGVPTYLTFTRLAVDPVGVVVTVIEVALVVVLLVKEPQHGSTGQELPRTVPSGTAHSPAELG